MKFEVDWEGDVYDCEWIESDDFSGIDKVSSIAGFIFDDEGKLCVVNFPKKSNWCLPGGHLEEYDDSFVDCLIREVEEEADLVLKDIVPIGYINAKIRGEEKCIPSQLRFVARVDKIREQTIDPCEGIIPERKFIDPADFIEHTGWEKGNGLRQLERALEVLKKL